MSRILPLCRTTTPTGECEKFQRQDQVLRAPRRPGPRRGHLRRQFPRSSDHHRDDARDARCAPPRCLRHLGLDSQRRQTLHQQPCGGGEVDGHAAAGPVAAWRSRGGRSIGHAEAARSPGPWPRVGRSLCHAAAAAPAAPRSWQPGHAQPRRPGCDGTRCISSLHRFCLCCAPHQFGGRCRWIILRWRYVSYNQLLHVWRMRHV